MVGYTLGGGVSFFSRKYGLSANNVRAVELVTADGQLRRADGKNEPDLFWALRGGGGSFGVVTAIELRLFPVTQVYAGILWYPIERGTEVLRTWRDLTRGDVPDELTTLSRFLRLPPVPDLPAEIRGKSFALVEAIHLGDPEQADALLAPLRALGPVNDTIKTITVPELIHLHMDPEQPVAGLGDGLMIARLPDEAMDALVHTAGVNAKFPLSSVEVRHLGGEIGRRRSHDGALSSLDAPYLMFAASITPTPELLAPSRAQIDAVEDALTPWAARHMYLNFSETTRPRAALWTRDAYHRLRQIKASADPGDVILSNHPILPGARVSGLEEEFDLSGGLPRLLYVKTPAPGREPRLADLLAHVKEEASASYRHFRTPAELSRLVRDDLAVLLSERFAGGAGQAAAAAPSPARARSPRPLPVSTTSLLGRERAIDEVAGLVERSGARLVTLTGPGGVGKTRLAVAVGDRLHDRFGAGTVFVPLEAVTDPELVLAAVGRMVGADLARTGSPLEALVETFVDGAWLLILDNLEQVLHVARDLGELLARCPGVVIVATSRTVLGLRAEREYPVQPLPAGPATASADEVAAWPAVALFVDRARAVRPDFELTEGNAAAVAEICRRLEGLPQAIELAAARTRLLDPPALLARLTASLDALGTGAVDLPARQRTLRATVEWSVGLLTDDERSLLEVTAVFVDGWTIQAAAQVASVDEGRALELLEALARHSLVHLDSTEPGPRSRMLETVREFVAERLAARPDAVEVGHRHAQYYRALAEQADRPLRGPGQDESLERMQAEAGNLAAAVRWYLAHDREPLPHLFRALWLFWTRRDREREARPWVEQLLPAAGTLDPQARAELAWVAAVLAVDTDDDTAALAARERLAPLLPGIGDPFLHAVSQLAMAWSLPITGDLDGALREVAASLDELQGQDEPVFTAIAAFGAGSLETALGRHEDASRHLREARDLAQRFDGDWLAAGCQAELGILEVLHGGLDQARTLLYQALDLSLTARSTPFVTLCLAAHAWLALAEGDPERAALLEGAAEGLRRRVGLPTWPLLRRVEADLVTQVRQRLDAGQFDQAFSAGAALTQREAVAIVRDQRGTGTQTP